MNTSALYYLVLVSEDPPKTYALTQDYIHIGRSRQNEIVVDNPHVSRIHARLIRQKDVYILEDLNSTNGTFVNERRVMHPVVLQVGDRIRLGPEVVFRFTGPEADLEPTRVVPVAERPAEEITSPGMPRPIPAMPPAAPTTPGGPVEGFQPKPGGHPTARPMPATPAGTVTRPHPPMTAAPGREILYTPRRRFPAWAWGCLAVMVTLCGVCTGWLWWVDATNQWCAYTLFRMLLPGCP